MQSAVAPPAPVVYSASLAGTRRPLSTCTRELPARPLEEGHRSLPHVKIRALSLGVSAVAGQGHLQEPTVHCHPLSAWLKGEVQKAGVLTVKLKVNALGLPSGVLCSLGSPLPGSLQSRLWPTCSLCPPGEPGVRTSVVDAVTGESGLLIKPWAPRTRAKKPGSQDS